MGAFGQLVGPGIPDPEHYGDDWQQWARDLGQLLPSAFPVQLPPSLILDNLPQVGIAVPSVADLKALKTRPDLVTTQGYFADDDGGGGPPWTWVAGDTTTPDDFLIVEPTAGAPGRYFRMVPYGGTVSPKWAGAGLGAADDTTRFQVVCSAAGAHAINLSGCTIPITNATFATASTCPGMFSDGTGTITCAPGTTNTTFLVTVHKPDWYLDRVFIDGPVSTTPAAPPACGTLLSFEPATPAAAASRQRVTNCRFRGGSTAVQFRNTLGSSLGAFTDNIVTNTWADATVVFLPQSFTYSRNQISNCGYDPSQTDAACHFTTNFSSAPADDLIVADNVIRDCCVGFNQEAMDFFGNLARNVVIAGNVIDQVTYGGMEFKSVLSAGVPDFYGDVLIANNIVNFIVGGAGIGVALNAYATNITNITQAANAVVTVGTPHGLTNGDVVYFSSVAGMTNINGLTGTVTAATSLTFTVNINSTAFLAYTFGGAASSTKKSIKRWKITGNHFLCDGAGSTSTGVQLAGMDNVDISDNSFQNIATAIGISVGNVASITNVNVLNNVAVVSGNPLLTSGVINYLAVMGNNFTSTGTMASQLLGTHNNLTFSGNSLTPAPSNFCAVFNDAHTGMIANNTAIGSHAGFVFGGTASTNLRIVSNNISCIFSPFSFATAAASIIVADNSVSCDVSVPIVGGVAAATPLNWGNKRAPMNVDPSATVAGTVGDVVPNYAPAAGGIWAWVCTTAGAAAAAVFKGIPVNP